MPATRPGLRFDESGLCFACLWHEEKKRIDWVAREAELLKIAAWARERSHSAWDCVIGVSGGKDSTWQAFYVRDRLGLNPLLVQYSSSEGNDLGRRNLENLVRHGFTLISVHPSPGVARKLARRSFIEFGNLCKYSETCLFPIPYRVAMAYEIPLVFFGENPALETGDSNRDRGNLWDATSIRFSNTLSGASLDIWLGDGIVAKDILPYTFPSDDEFQQWNGRGIFMGYYLNWSGFKNALFAIQQGLQCWNVPAEDLGCHVKHNTLDWDGIPANSMLKHMKLGFGHTTEFSCYDIREGRVSREEAIALVKAYDGKCGESFLETQCRWLGMSKEEFRNYAVRFYGEMWDKSGPGQPSLRDPIWEQEPPSRSIDCESIVHRLDTVRLAAESQPLSLYDAQSFASTGVA